MKKQMLILAFLYMAVMALGQAPPAFQYQAVTRDPAGNILSNKNVSYRLSIQQGTVTGAIVYTERHYTATNEFGLVTLEIGKGTVDTGTLAGINWGADPHFLKVELDINGGDNFQLMGSSQLLSVPYALHANTVQRGDNWGIQAAVPDLTLTGNGTVASPLGLAQQGASTGQVLKWSGSGWIPSPVDPGPWSKNGSNLYYLTGNVGIGTSTPDQQLTLSGRNYTQMHCVTSASGSTSSDGMVAGLSDDGAWLWNYENAELFFGTNNTKRMSISSGGDVTLTENLFMDSGKKIGIGVDNPTNIVELMGGISTFQKFYHSTSGTTSADGLLVGLQQGSNRSYVWSYEAGALYLGTDNTYGMGVFPEGRIGIGTTAPSFMLDVAGPANLNKTDAAGPALYVHGDEALYYNGTYFRWGLGCTYNYFSHAVNIGTSTSPGTHLLVVNGTAAKPGGGSWVTWSDARLKDVLGAYDKGLEEIAALEPVRFTYKEGNPLNLPADREYAGFIAQDIRKIFPEAVSEGRDGYLNFDGHAVNMAMVNAIRELKTENERLKGDLKKMNDRLTRIEHMMRTEAKK